MKRIIYSLGLMLAATLTLTNCAKEIDAPVVESEGVPFEIVASTADTKTVNDGISTKWEAEDQINLFHAVTGSTTYVSDAAFTVEDAATGLFKGKLTSALADDQTYDWYVLYPYSEYVKTPGEQTSGYTYIGHSKGLNQTGYNSMASLKGDVCPLYGIAEKVPAGQTPSVTMKHLSSVIAINVTNKNDEPLTVTTASFTATEDIVGSYFIDVTKSPVVYTPKTAQNTATVTVKEGTALAKGESAVLYLAIKPFKAAKDAKLYLSVNGYSKELVLPKDVTFAAGKIKTLNFGYDAPTAIYETAFDYAIVGSNYQSSSEIIGTDEGTTTSWGIVYGNWNSSNCAQMRVYKAGDFGSTYMKFDVSYATSVSYKAKVDNAALKLNTYYSIDSGETWIKVDNNKTLTTSLNEYSFVVSETGAYDKVRVKFEAAGDAPTSGNYQLTIDDVKIYGKGEVLVEKDPTIIVEKASVSVGASSVLAEFEYSLIDIEGEPSVSVTSDEYSIIDGEPSVSGGIVSVNLKENTENIAKSATLTLSYTGADDVILTVNQAAYVDLSDQKAYAKVSSITSGETYLLVAEYAGGEYIFNGSSVAASTPSVDASSYKVDSKIVSNETTDKCAVVITSVGDNYTIKLSTGKYLVVNSSTSNNSNLSSDNTAEELKVQIENGKFLFVSTNMSKRALVYRDGYNFKNYAVSNAKTSGYCGYLTLYQLED